MQLYQHVNETTRQCSLLIKLQTLGTLWKVIDMTWKWRQLLNELFVSNIWDYYKEFVPFKLITTKPISHAMVDDSIIFVPLRIRRRNEAKKGVADSNED